MDLVLLVLIGVGLYFVADWLLRQVERYRGEPFVDRTLIFFAIFLILALLVFQVFRRL